MAESIVFSGKIGEVVHFTQPDGRVFEQYRRSPGTRLIIISPENKILITQEHRHESATIDLRLPGGKVCDTIEQYTQLRQSKENILDAAIKGAIREAHEETGLIIKNPQFLIKANAGSTVEWDLYYFLIREFEIASSGQQLEKGEEIKVTWMDIEGLRKAINAGRMKEWRSVGVLLGLVLPTLVNQ